MTAADFGVVRTKGVVGFLIRVVTRSRYNHAFMVMGDGTIVEAESKGAQRNPMRYPTGTYLLSDLELTDVQRAGICAWAAGAVGTPYGFLDLLSIGALQYGIRPKFIRDRVRRSDRLICSQLVDQAYLAAGVHLFSDGRLSMDVTPGDLGHLLGA